MDEVNTNIMQCIDKLQIVRHMMHRKVMEGYSLYRGQLPILEHVSAFPGCTQVEIAQALLITPSSVAQSTKRMQRDGLLNKQVSNDNQRSNQLYVTDRGRKIAEDCRRQFDEIDSAICSVLYGEEIALLPDMLGRMLKAAAQRAALDVENMNLQQLLQMGHGCHSPGGPEGGEYH